MAPASKASKLRPRRPRAGQSEVSHARERRFRADAAELADVRAFLRQTVAERDSGEPAFGEFVVTELATNSIVHARTDFTVRVGFTPTYLRIEVADESNDPPLLGRNQPAVHGLEMVDRLVNDWGYELRDDGGKSVWADIALRSVR
jgi:anti-sigma regulatory factor (Ser/Thr protein kinase)